VTLLLSACGGGAKFKGDSSEKSPTPNPNPEPPVIQPKDEEIRFGVDKVFRIGDDNYSNTSCKQEVASYNLSGTRYFFEFQVTQPQTVVNISINKVCGVDYADSNATRLTNGVQVLQVQPVAASNQKIQYQSVTLNPGTYAVLVESKVNYSRIRQGDFDDFLVGDIAIVASKKIEGGRVRTE
jgi:hypothetical protein